MSILTLRGLIEVKRHEVRRARNEKAGRYPVKLSLRLDRATYTAVLAIQRCCAPELTMSELTRILIEYAAVFAPLRDDILTKMRMNDEKCNEM